MFETGDGADSVSWSGAVQAVATFARDTIPGISEMIKHYFTKMDLEATMEAYMELLKTMFTVDIKVAR